MLFKSIGITPRSNLEVILRTTDIVRWVFLDSPLWYGLCIEAVTVFQLFFLQPTQRASSYYFRKIYRIWFLSHLFCRHDLFTFQIFCACVEDTFLVPNESHDNRWRESEKQWSQVLHEYRFICISISRFISLIFLSTSFALNMDVHVNYTSMLQTRWVFTCYFVILKI